MDHVQKHGDDQYLWQTKREEGEEENETWSIEPQQAFGVINYHEVDREYNQREMRGESMAMAMAVS